MKNTTCWKVPSTRGINFFLPPNARVALILYHKRSWLCSIVILRAAICAASSSGKPSSLTLWPSSYIKVIAVIRRIYIFTVKLSFVCVVFYFHLFIFFILFISLFYFICLACKVIFFFFIFIFLLLNIIVHVSNRRLMYDNYVRLKWKSN